MSKNQGTFGIEGLHESNLKSAELKVSLPESSEVITPKIDNEFYGQNSQSMLYDEINYRNNHSLEFSSYNPTCYGNSRICRKLDKIKQYISYKWRINSKYIPARRKTTHKSKWDPSTCSEPPACNPNCLRKLQNKLPWLCETKKYYMLGPWVSSRGFEVPYRSYKHEFIERLRIPGERAWLFLRIFIILSLITLFLILNVILELPYFTVSDYSYIYDPIHEATKNISSYIRNSDIFRNFLVLIASFCMDMVVLLSWFEWAIFGDSSRLLVCYVLFYGIRALMKLICTFPYPKEYKWDAPTINGFRVLSLVVPYQQSDDFFYSGHVGCCALTAIEHFYNRRWLSMYFSITVGVVESFTLTMMRAHYTVDMVIGVIMAHYTHHVARKFSRYIDQWMGLPIRLTLLEHDNTTSNSSIV